MSKFNSKDYEKFGKLVLESAENNFVNRRQLYKHAFIKGIFSGLGGVVGASIVVALLVWLLSLFTQVPLLGTFVEKIEDTVQSNR